MDSGSRSERGNFKTFSSLVVRLMLDPVDVRDKPSFEDWLSHSKYSAKQQQRFKQLRQSIDSTDYRDKGLRIWDNASFIKWESYTEPKAARAINSYSDTLKVLLGPIVHAVDLATFKCGYFVKGSSPLTWPARLQELFADRPVVGTDFTSMEAHHTTELADVVYDWMMYMTSGMQLRVFERQLFTQCFQGRQKSRFSNIDCQVNQHLMSGAPWTSSANGMLNLLLNMYLCLRTKYPELCASELATHWSEFVGLVEGDDGLFDDFNPSQQLIDDLGLRLKFDHYANYRIAKFCSIVCNGPESQPVPDPIKMMRKMFVLEPKYSVCKDSTRRALMRAKALSYKYLYGDSPVVGPLCDWILARTKGVSVRQSLTRDPHYWVDLLDKDVLDCWKKRASPSLEARALVHQVYGITEEMQLLWESCFDATSDVCRVPLASIVSPVDIDHCLRDVLGAGCVFRRYRDDIVDQVIASRGLEGSGTLRRSRLPQAYHVNPC